MKLDEFCTWNSSQG